MSIETARLVRKLVPYDDGSGHRYTVTVSRSRKASDGEAEVSISIETGSDVVTIDSGHWPTVRDAVQASLDHVYECLE